jgi:hypothetical protein
MAKTTKISKLEKRLASAQKTSRNLRASKESDLSKALGVLGGAYAGGAAAQMMPELFGMPTQGVVGVAAYAVGWATDSCVAKNVALGNLAALVSDMGRGHMVDAAAPAAGA